MLWVLIWIALNEYPQVNIYFYKENQKKKNIAYDKHH